MKRTILWLGMLAMVLAFGMTVVGCDNGNDDGGGSKSTALDGTWTNTDYSGIVQEVSLNGSNWSVKLNGTNQARGTLTLPDPNATTGRVSFTGKEMWYGSSWEAIVNQTATVDYVMNSQKTTITFSNLVGSEWFDLLEGTWTKK